MVSKGTSEHGENQFHTGHVSSQYCGRGVPKAWHRQSQAGAEQPDPQLPFVRPGWHPAPRPHLSRPSPTHDFAERYQSKQRSYLHLLYSSLEG